MPSGICSVSEVLQKRVCKVVGDMSVRLLVLTRAQLLIDQMLPELHEKLSTPRSLLTLSSKLARDVLTQISVSRTTKTRSTSVLPPLRRHHETA